MRRPPNQPPKWGIFKLAGKEGLVVKDIMPKGRKPCALSWSSRNDDLRASPELTWFHLWWDQDCKGCNSFAIFCFRWESLGTMSTQSWLEKCFPDSTTQRFLPLWCKEPIYCSSWLCFVVMKDAKTAESYSLPDRFQKRAGEANQCVVALESL